MEIVVTDFVAGARGLNQRLISRPSCFPINAVKFIVIKIVAHITPALTENFHFFRREVDVHFKLNGERANFAAFERDDVQTPVFEVINLFSIRRKLRVGFKTGR